MMPLPNLWIAIVQNADSSSLLDDPDAALQCGPSEKTRGHAAASLLKSARLNFKTDFNKLWTPNAQRLLRFGQAREVSARSA
jgi:hypothetical protein